MSILAANRPDESGEMMSNVTRISEAVARPVRTGAQGGVGWAITEGIDAFLYDMNDRQYGILVILLTMLISFIQNVIENQTGTAILRKAPPTSVPLVDTTVKEAA